jgi:cytochrome c556
MTRLIVSMVSVLGIAMITQACSDEASRTHAQRGVEQVSNHKREPLRLGAHERQLVLAEMRQMLESTEGVVAGLAKNDMAAIEQAAARSGRQAPETVDEALHGALPEEFLRMGAAAHGGFDGIAQLARDRATIATIAAKLGETLSSCNTCHANYRLDVGE